MLPIEVCELILEKIDDPAELLRLQQVSKAWSQTITIVLSRPEQWKKFCRSNIPNKCLRNVLEQKFPTLMNHLNCFVPKDHPLHPNIWKDIYYAWKRLQTGLTEVNCSISKTWQPNNVQFIRCSAVWDDIVALGLVTDQIEIHFYKINDLNNPFCAYITMEEMIEEIKFWYTDNRLIAVLRFFNGSLRFWDIQQKRLLDHAEFFCRSFYIKQNRCYSIHRKVFSKFELRSNVVQRSWEIVVPLQPKERVYGVDTNECSVHVLIHNWTNRHITKVYNFTTISGPDGEQSVITDEVNAIIEIYRSNVPQDNNGIHQYFVFSQDIMLDIYEEWIAVSVQRKPWVVYKNAINQLGGRICSATSYANLFIFGLYSGSVYIFRVNNVEDLLHLDFATLDSKKIKLHDIPIKHVDVIYSQEQLMIIAGSFDDIYCIKLF